MRRLFIALTVAAVAFASAAGGEGLVIQGSVRSITLPEPTITLKSGPGMDVAARFCAVCHSLDYITTQQKQPKSKWQAAITKMVKVYGAPVTDENAKIIADYIAAAYGMGD